MDREACAYNLFNGQALIMHNMTDSIPHSHPLQPHISLMALSVQSFNSDKGITHCCFIKSEDHVASNKKKADKLGFFGMSSFN